MLADLNLPGLALADLPKKIKTIRTKYAAELTKIKKSERSGAGSGDVYKPRIFWFDIADSFLRSGRQTKTSSSNLKVRHIYFTIYYMYIEGGFNA